MRFPPGAAADTGRLPPLPPPLPPVPPKLPWTSVPVVPGGLLLPPPRMLPIPEPVWTFELPVPGGPYSPLAELAVAFPPSSPLVPAPPGSEPPRSPAPPVAAPPLSEPLPLLATPLSPLSPLLPLLPLLPLPVSLLLLGPLPELLLWLPVPSSPRPKISTRPAPMAAPEARELPMIRPQPTGPEATATPRSAAWPTPTRTAVTPTAPWASYHAWGRKCGIRPAQLAMADRWTMRARSRRTARSERQRWRRRRVRD